MAFSVALFEPEIPPNTGNIIRLCANTGFRLHLIGPLGFSLQEKQLRRAGLDYHEYARVEYWDDWDNFCIGVKGRLVSLSTKSRKPYSEFQFKDGDVLLFGSETKGLSQEARNRVDPDCRLTIPMHQGSRSLNLSNSVAVVVYEAWRQNNFCDLNPG